MLSNRENFKDIITLELYYYAHLLSIYEGLDVCLGTWNVRLNRIWCLTSRNTWVNNYNDIHYIL